MKSLLPLLLVAFTSVAVANDDAPWSKPDHGMRGRLSFGPPNRTDSPFLRVFLELQNTEDVMGQKKIRFSPGKLKLAVLDKDGKALEESGGPYDGMSPFWEPIALPMEGTIKFRISFPGLGYWPGEDKVIIDVGGKAWVIPQTANYYFSGTLTIERKEGDHPYMDWSGTLELPKVEIPKAK